MGHRTYTDDDPDTRRAKRDGRAVRAAAQEARRTAAVRARVEAASAASAAAAPAAKRPRKAPTPEPEPEPEPAAAAAAPEPAAAAAAVAADDTVRVTVCRFKTTDVVGRSHVSATRMFNVELRGVSAMTLGTLFSIVGDDDGDKEERRRPLVVCRLAADGGENTVTVIPLDHAHVPMLTVVSSGDELMVTCTESGSARDAKCAVHLCTLSMRRGELPEPPCLALSRARANEHVRRVVTGDSHTFFHNGLLFCVPRDATDAVYERTLTDFVQTVHASGSAHMVVDVTRTVGLCPTVTPLFGVTSPLLPSQVSATADVVRDAGGHVSTRPVSEAVGRYGMSHASMIQFFIVVLQQTQLHGKHLTLSVQKMLEFVQCRVDGQNAKALMSTMAPALLPALRIVMELTSCEGMPTEIARRVIDGCHPPLDMRIAEKPPMYVRRVFLSFLVKAHNEGRLAAVALLCAQDIFEHAELVSVMFCATGVLMAASEFGVPVPLEVFDSGVGLELLQAVRGRTCNVRPLATLLETEFRAYVTSVDPGAATAVRRTVVQTVFGSGNADDKQLPPTASSETSRFLWRVHGAAVSPDSAEGGGSWSDTFYLASGVNVEIRVENRGRRWIVTRFGVAWWVVAIDEHITSATVLLMHLASTMCYRPWWNWAAAADRVVHLHVCPINMRNNHVSSGITAAIVQQTDGEEAKRPAEIRHIAVDDDVKISASIASVSAEMTKWELEFPNNARVPAPLHRQQHSTSAAARSLAPEFTVSAAASASQRQ